MSILTRTIFENKQTLKFPLVQFIFFSFLLPLHHYHFKFLALNPVFGVDGNARSSTNPNSEDPKDGNKSGGEKNAASYDDHLTPSREKIHRAEGETGDREKKWRRNYLQKSEHLEEPWNPRASERRDERHSRVAPLCFSQEDGVEKREKRFSKGKGALQRFSIKRKREVRVWLFLNGKSHIFLLFCFSHFF